MISEGLKVLSEHKGKALYVEEHGLVVGELASILVPEKEKPIANWTGTPIPKSIIRKCASFSKYCMRRYGGEVQGRLYYDRKTGEWATLVVKQFVSRSLESQEEGTEGNIEDALLNLPEGNFVQMGTWHSHEKCGAHQSPTDYADEIKQNGVHITLGNFGRKQFNIHTRITHHGINYDKGMGLDNEILDSSTSMNTKGLPNFPAYWIDALVERPVPEKVKTLPAPASVPRGEQATLELFECSEISIDDFVMVKAMMSKMFPGEDFQSLCRKLHNMENERIEAETFYQDVEYACGFCGEQTSSMDGICDECAGYMQNDVH